MDKWWRRALVGIGALVLNAHAAPMPLPDEVPTPEWFKLTMSRDGLGLWLYVLPSRSSTNLPRDDRAHVYVRGDPKYPGRGDRSDPQLFVQCRAPLPARLEVGGHGGNAEDGLQCDHEAPCATAPRFAR